MTCPLECTASAKLTLTQKTARQLHVNRRTLRKLERSVKAGATRRVTISVPSKTKKTAKRRGVKSLQVVLALTVTQADRQDKTGRRTLKIRL